ncbi:hypothetical protein LZ009_12630 [Ramlibacter sp. XY19]|uniref:hypothetical protein n=1 Tax=Ramlibacter paludis TaxID=2908000 RepID=UPI0023DC5B34|nr:hypothetical protein [Ramlibacter paludis]MCG2593624.1 hypothetical protein [Ramlibacter paludis]
MSTNTSIGPGPARGGNEDHGNADGCGNKTLGEHAVPQEPEAGAADARQPPQGPATPSTQER